MDIVNKAIDDCDLRKWLVSERAMDEKFGAVSWIDERTGNELNACGWERILHRFEFENEFWKWRVDFEEDSDIDPGILAIRSLTHKPNPNEIEKTIYYGDLLCQNTCKGTRNNFLTLINSPGLDEYFNKRFSMFDRLEEELRKFYNIKVPFPLRTKFNWNLNSHNADYYIEIYGKDSQEQLAVLIPLVDEWYQNWNDKIEEEDGEGGKGEGENEKQVERNGEYRIHVFPPAEAILKKHKGETVQSTYWNWDCNCRNIYVYWRQIHYYSSDLNNPELSSFLFESISKIHEYARNRVATLECPPREEL